MALVRVDRTPNAVVGLDFGTKLETSGYEIVRGLKGELKSGSTAQLSIPVEGNKQGMLQAIVRLDDAWQTYLVTYKRTEDNLILVQAFPAGEVELRVAAKLFDTPYETLKAAAEETVP